MWASILSNRSSPLFLESPLLLYFSSMYIMMGVESTTTSPPLSVKTGTLFQPFVKASSFFVRIALTCTSSTSRPRCSIRPRTFQQKGHVCNTCKDARLMFYPKRRPFFNPRQGLVLVASRVSKILRCLAIPSTHRPSKATTEMRDSQDLPDCIRGGPLPHRPDANAPAFVVSVFVHPLGCRSSFRRHPEVRRAIASCPSVRDRQHVVAIEFSYRTATNP